MDKEEALMHIDRFIGNVKTAYTALFQYLKSMDPKTMDDIKYDVGARLLKLQQYIEEL